MLRKCKNKSFHDYLFVAKKSSHKYCDLPECKKFEEKKEKEA